MIKVFGHKAPDTDATCTPIVYAWFLNKINKKAEAFILGEFNRETKFVLEHFNIQTPKVLEKLNEGDEVVILDTNNPDELPDNLESTKILEIIDHHKLAGLKTNSPLRINMKPVGCTSTIVYQLIKQESVDLDKDMAGLLLAAILSDTLKFTSPTTTNDDQQAAENLAEISGIDMEKLANDMFAAKSDLAGMDPKDILLSDSKVFEMGDKKVRVSVHETTKPENSIGMSEDLKRAMNEIKASEKLDAMYFFVVDILKSQASLIVSNDEEINKSESAFEQKFNNGFLSLEGVVSRKKQMVPSLEKAYSNGKDS